MTKLDYTIESPEERKALVEKILAETPDISSSYLEILADYLVLCMEKQEKKQKKILTDNRMSTVNKRECSFEGLAAQMENGEDGIYSLMSDDRAVLFQPKISITEHDLETISCLRQLRESINAWDAALKRIAGSGKKEAYMMRKALIEMRKDQYLIKQAYQKPIVPCRLTRSTRTFPSLDDKSYMFLGKDGQEVKVEGFSLMNEEIVSLFLNNYSKLKQDSYDQFEGDMWYEVQVFEDLCDRALADYPILYRILEMKIDKLQNSEIRDILKKEFGKTYTPEYISSLWCNKIPQIIATQALEEFIFEQYKAKDYPFKKCTKCGQLKPAHNQFFSKNKTSADGWYSICKRCRSKKRGIE